MESFILDFPARWRGILSRVFAVFLNFSPLVYIKAGVEFLAKSRYQRYINWPPAEP